MKRNSSVSETSSRNRSRRSNQWRNRLRSNRTCSSLSNNHSQPCSSRSSSRRRKHSNHSHSQPCSNHSHSQPCSSLRTTHSNRRFSKFSSQHGWLPVLPSRVAQLWLRRPST